MFRYLTLLLLFFSQNLFALETDNFTSFYSSLADSYDVVESAIAKGIENAAARSNSRSNFCNYETLYSELKDEFTAPVVSHFESFLQHSDKIERATSSGLGIYKNYTLLGPYSTLLVFSYLAPVINLAGIKIGTDKFSHFFNEGWRYFETAYLKNRGEITALKEGIGTEEGFLGKFASGLYSYGDLVANYNGMLFFADILIGKEPFVKCENNRWVYQKNFKLINYIDQGYNEAINCNEFANDNLRYAFELSIEELQQSDNLNYTCPIIRDECPKLRERYKEIADYLISPRC